MATNWLDILLASTCESIQLVVSQDKSGVAVLTIIFAVHDDDCDDDYILLVVNLDESFTHNDPGQLRKVMSMK